jgi:hypothetical protein
MAKYTITYPDGEQEEIQLFGKHTERERRIAYLEQYGVSPKQREQERREATEEAKAEAAGKGLPELKGTEKQVNWAETIRANVFKKLNQDPAYKNYLIITNPEKYQELKSKAIDGGMPESEFIKWNQPVYDMFIEADKRLKSEDKASWWIDNRSNYFNGLYLVQGLYPDITKKYTEHKIAYRQWKEGEAQEPKTSASLPQASEARLVQSKSTPPKKETRQYTQAELQKIHNSRKPQSIAMDESQPHAVTLNPDSPKVRRWVNDQGRADIKGIDSPRKSSSRGTPSYRKAKVSSGGRPVPGMPGVVQRGRRRHAI